MELFFRKGIKPEDVDKIKVIVHETGFFRPEETAVAVELAEEAVQNGEKSGYLFIIVEDETGNFAGYSCYGEIPYAKGRYDLYWIVVKKEMQGKKIGKALINKTFEDISKRQGKIVYIETSSLPIYVSTRYFYENCGCIQEAEIKDFYANGDHKLIYSFRL